MKMNIVLLFWILCFSSIIGYLINNKEIINKGKITSKVLNKNNRNEKF